MVSGARSESATTTRLSLAASTLNGLGALGPIEASICETSVDDLRHCASFTRGSNTTARQGLTVYVTVGVLCITFAIVVGVGTVDIPSTLAILAANAID